jgi:hypothetical protein
VDKGGGRGGDHYWLNRREEGKEEDRPNGRKGESNGRFRGMVRRARLAARRRAEDAIAVLLSSVGGRLISEIWAICIKLRFCAGRGGLI